MSAWINRNIPEWSHFKIRGMLKYVGAYLGPDAGGELWTAPVIKYRGRTLKISSPRPPHAAACAEYNSRALPVLSYIAQLSSLPARVWRLDVDGARRMYGFAPNSLEWKQ